MYANTVTNITGEHIVPLSDTIQPLLIAPLAGIAVLTCATLVNAGADMVAVFPFLAIRIAPFCYAAAVVFVVPILVTWPPSRHPTYPIAAVWGIVSAVVSLAALVAGLGLGTTPTWSGLLPFIAAGAASGLLYAYGVERRCRRKRQIEAGPLPTIAD